jgi:LAGLIDADG DNA endonuclease family
MLLGDGSLGIPYKRAQLVIEQKDREFVQLLWEKFDSIGIVGAIPFHRFQLDKRTGKTYESYRFSSFTLPYLTELHSIWYKKNNGKNVKIIPSNIEELLTPIALAYWLASDSGFNKKHGILVISTESFLFEEVQILSSILQKKYNIHNTINTHGKNKFVIRIAKSSMGSLQTIVTPFFPPSMKYRIGL